MRILHVNKFLYRRGGAESYMFDVSGLQGKAGHETAYFAMADPENEPSVFEAHFPSYVQFNPLPASLLRRARSVGRLMYSPGARRGLEEVLERFGPDIVHLHNIYHQLSPSVLRPLAQSGIPAVMTLHDYKLACPTYLFLANGEICEACLGGHFYQAVLKRCNNRSLVASAVNALEMTLHTVTKAYGGVDRFSCPSKFLLGKMRAAGVFPDRLRYCPNFVDASMIEPQREPGRGVVYGGRLRHEKGIDVLIRAASRLGVRVDVAGDGPDRSALESLARDAGADVRFHGRLPVRALHDLIRSASVAVLPARWYENQPLFVLESFACGVPVVATELGGIPELIEPGVDGDRVAPNDPEALAQALRPFVADPGLAHEMGKAGRMKVDRRFSPQEHLRRLHEIYDEAIRAASVKGASASAGNGRPEVPR